MDHFIIINKLKPMLLSFGYKMVSLPASGVWGTDTLWGFSGKYICMGSGVKPLKLTVFSENSSEIWPLRWVFICTPPSLAVTVFQGGSAFYKRGFNPPNPPATRALGASTQM